MGIVDILLYVRVERFTGFGPIVSLISGALSVMTGVMLLVYPNAGKWVMSLLFPLWFLAHCIGRLVRPAYGPPLGRGLYLLFHADHECAWPDPRRSDAGRSAGLVAVRRYLVSFYLVLLGVDCIILAFSKLGSRE